MFQRALVGHNELLYFADVCAGPGGFSEYVLWRRKWAAKGFGFTLKGDCDFKLEDFCAAPSELFEPHYGGSRTVASVIATKILINDFSVLSIFEV